MAPHVAASGSPPASAVSDPVGTGLRARLRDTPIRSPAGAEWYPAANPPPPATGEGSARAGLVLLAATSFWSLNFSVMKFGISEVQPLAFAVIRFGLAGLVLLALLRLREGSVGMRRADVPLLVLAAILGIALCQGAFVFALANTSASNVALLASTGPILTALLATAVGFERSGARHWIAALAGFGGAVLIVQGGANAPQAASSLFGDALALISFFFVSASAFPIMFLVRRYSVHRVLAYQMIVGTAFLIPFAVPSLLTQDYRLVSPAGWGALAYAVFFSGIVANLLYFSGMSRVGPSRATMFQYLQSFMAVLFAVLLLRESVTPVQLLGGGIVVSSFVLNRRRPLSGHRARRPATGSDVESEADPERSRQTGRGEDGTCQPE